MNRRLKCILAAELIALGFTLVLVIPGAVEAWTSVHLTAATECVADHTVAHVTADNTEDEAAHVVGQSGGAWAVGDDIPKPSQTRDVTITGATAFQVTVNYQSDSTYRPSNTVTVDIVQGCHATTTTESTSTSTSSITSSSTSSSTTSTAVPTTTAPATTSTECVNTGGQVSCDHPSSTVPVPSTRPPASSTPSTATSVPMTPTTSGTVEIVPSANVTAVSATPAFTG